MQIIKTVIGTAILTASMSVSAAVIDFNDTAMASDGAIAGCAQTYSYKYCHSGAITYDGYVFSHVNESDARNYFIGNDYNNSDSANTPYDGNDFMLARSGILVSQSGGGTFSLNQLDITNWYDRHNDIGYYSPSNTWRVTGNLSSGGTVVQELVLDDIGNSADRDGNDFETFVLSGFDDITSFVIDVQDNGYYYMSIDNIVVDASVPEPATIALFGLGLLGIGFARSRQAD